MYPGLTHGAYAALHAHGTRRAEADLPAQADQRRVDRHHVPDRAALRHRPGPDAHQGRTAGRRQLQASPATRSSSAPASTTWRSNIIHLVLARLPDAPPGSKGISLFIVPKFLVNKDGSPGRAQRHLLRRPGAQDGHPRQRHRADRASTAPSACMVGQPNKGLQAMFVMMNAARLGVGNQSLGLTEVAYQNALAYAKDRIQMRIAVRPEGQGQAGRPDHRAPRRAQDAADRQGLCRRRPRAGDLLRGAAGQGALHHPDEKVRKDSDELVVAAHADREGLHSPTTATSPPTPACRCSAATASSRNGAWSSSCATTAST